MRVGAAGGAGPDTGSLQGGWWELSVFRIDADDWPIVEAAAREHGSIQSAVLAGIRALNQTRNVGRMGRHHLAGAADS